MSIESVNGLLHTVLINLDRSPDRLAAIDPMFHAAGIAYDRLPAIDGAGLDLDDPVLRAKVDARGWVRYHHRNPLRAEIGCYLSHVAALERFLASGKPSGMIVEDDAALPANLADVLYPALLDAPWDILNLHVRHPGPLVRRASCGPGAALYSFIAKHSGATCYVVNRTAAAVILEHAFPATRPFDWMFTEGYRLNLRIRLLHPMPVSLRPIPSTIEIERKRSRAAWLEKYTDKPLWPRRELPFRRAANEVNRLTYNLISDGGLASLLRPTREN